MAGQPRPAALAASVRAAFVPGRDTAVLVPAGITLVGIVLALAFPPGRSAAIEAGREPEKKGESHAVAG